MAVRQWEDAGGWLLGRGKVVSGWLLGQREGDGGWLLGRGKTLEAS